MPKRKQSDSTNAHRRRSGVEQWLNEVPLADAPELRGPTEVDEETIGHTATKHCILYYPTLYTAGVPELSSSTGDKVWVAPIVLRSPIHGTLGTVGEIRIDARSGKVLDSTPSKEVVAKGKQLYEERIGADSSTSIQPNER
jgi:hypothetical protein